MEQSELPLGFAMALGMNEPAMKRFEEMTEAEKEEFLQRTHAVQSKREMQLLVASLAARPGNGMLGYDHLNPRPPL